MTNKAKGAGKFRKVEVSENHPLETIIIMGTGIVVFEVIRRNSPRIKRWIDETVRPKIKMLVGRITGQNALENAETEQMADDHERKIIYLEANDFDKLKEELESNVAKEVNS